MDGSNGKSSRTASSVQNILRSGSPRVLKVVDIAAELKRAGPDPALLFRTTALNRSVLFKDLHAPNAGDGDTRMRVGTKIYVPFDGNHLEDGGMTVFFSRYTFANAMRDMVDMGDKQRQADLAADIAILDTLNSLPTFAPFLVKDCFSRNAIKADPLYSAIPEDEWKAIQEHIRGRFSQILCAVSGGAANSKQAAMDKLIDKLWDLKDIPALEGLAAAFGLDPSNCVETFYSWKGILYFAWVFTEVRETTYEMLGWIDNWHNLITVYPPNQRAAPKEGFEHARRAISKMLNRVETTLTEYDHAFDELFVSGSGPHRFVKFLASASDHFQTCGAGLGLLQHAYEVWNNSTRAFPERKATADATTHVLQAIEDIIPV